MSKSNQPTTNLRAKTPQRPGLLHSKGQAFLGLGAGSVILICVLAAMVAAVSPASQSDQRPFWTALLTSATPEETDPPPEPTETETAIPPSETPDPTHTLTPLPTEEEAASTLTVTASPTPVLTPEMEPDDRDRVIRVPILMYHYVSVPPEDADVYRVDLSVTPDNFRQQMAWLSDHGYETITLNEMMYALNMGNPDLPEKPVIITFDDGYEDNYENAFPILQEFGFTGTFFILTDVTDRSEPGYMTWDMIREMSEAGMRFEVHGREHIELANRDRDFLIYHLLGPAQTIEANLGYQPRFIAYPSGRYDEFLISMAGELGYWGGLTTIFGSTQDKAFPFELQRLRVRGDWSLHVFSAVITEE